MLCYVHILYLLVQYFFLHFYWGYVIGLTSFFPFQDAFYLLYKLVCMNEISEKLFNKIGIIPIKTWVFFIRIIINYNHVFSRLEHFKVTEWVLVWLTKGNYQSLLRLESDILIYNSLLCINKVQYKVASCCNCYLRYLYRLKWNQSWKMLFWNWQRKPCRWEYSHSLLTILKAISWNFGWTRKERN